MARIVLIEDNLDLRELLADVLTEHGHTVWPTQDAEVGIALCDNWGPDMVITDLIVPHWEALENLLPERAATIPRVIVVSGALQSPENASLARRLAGSNVIAKPFHTGELLRLVERVLADSPVLPG